MIAMAKQNVMETLRGLAQMSSGHDKHRVEICGGRSPYWWEHAWDEVQAVEVTDTQVKLYV